MKKFILGLIVGIIIATSGFALANPNQIRLIVNGVDITDNFEVKPMIINDRTMVPAKPLAEALGAKVDWDNEKRAVIITSVDLPPVSGTIGSGEGIDVILSPNEQLYFFHKINTAVFYGGPKFYPEYFKNFIADMGDSSGVAIYSINYFNRGIFSKEISVEFIADNHLIKQERFLGQENTHMGVTSAIYANVAIFPKGTRITEVKLTWNDNGIKTLSVPVDFVVE